MPDESEFSAADFAMVRVSALPARHDALFVPGDLEPACDLLAFVSAVAADPAVREAIAVSSASLDAALERITSGEAMEPKRLRGAALSAVRYMARMACRPTPFGLLAGVAPARFDTAVTVRFGAEHRKRVRPDMGWLIAVIRGWETDDAVVPRLRLVVNDLCFVRDDRLILPYVEAPDDGLVSDGRERTVRHTAAVRAVLAAARTPIRHRDLVDQLVQDFPRARRARADRMVRQLIEQDFLLTDLRPPAAEADPLRYVLERLDPEFPGHRALARVLAALERYAAAPVGSAQGLAAWRAAAGELRRLPVPRRGGRPAADTANRSRAGTPVQVDLRMDADIVLPREVATELARAATVAWRIAARQFAPARMLADYHAEFLERYGAGALVPVKELLDPSRGLGPPAGYREPPGDRPARDLEPQGAERDAALFGLVQQAAARGDREIVLSEAMVERLARRDGAHGRYLEACAELLAPSERALRDGDFRLVLDSDSSQARPGALLGRFLHQVPEFTRPLADLAAELTGRHGDDAAAAQLTHVLMQARSGNLNRIPRLTEHAAEVGVYGDRSRPETYGLDELLAGADHDGFFLISASTGRQIVPLGFSALNLALCLPNAARFLTEIGLARFGPWVTWHWGRASRLAYLPRVRYERTVLAPARWRPPADLANAAAGWDQWRRLWDQWRAEWDVPPTVRAGVRDIQMTLNLTCDTHLRLLRAELSKRAGTVLVEEPMGGEYGTGWAGGRAVQVVIPLKPRNREPRLAPTARRMQPQEVPARSLRREHRPGGEWCYVKIYAPAARHNQILTRHLPELLTSAAALTDRWFFIRYRDEHAHLRVRFHGTPAALNTHLLPLVHQWADSLAAAGLIQDITLDTYRPEINRYGGPAALERAEQAFCADSGSVLEQLALRAGGKLDLPSELLAAANMIDLAAQLDPDGWRDWLLRTYHKGPKHTAFQRIRAQALDIGDSRDGWSRLRARPGGDQLAASWQRRAASVAEFGQCIRQQADSTARSAAFAGMIHMNHNRLAGVDAAAEAAAHAIARGIVQAISSRDQHLTQPPRPASPQQES